MDLILQGDAATRLKELPDESVDLCVTSPPYYQLRDYGVEGQIGLEGTGGEYIGRLVEVFEEVRRVLKRDGNLYINIGDSYAGSGKGAANYPENALKYLQGTNKGLLRSGVGATKGGGVKPKNLIGIPWRLAFALQERGWNLREDIIWAKPNPMPESVTDRCTRSHEYIFHFTKEAHYYYDAAAISEPSADSTVARIAQDVEHQVGSSRAVGKTNGKMKACKPRYCGKKYTEHPEQLYRTKSGNAYDFRPRRNKRDVWTVTTKPCKEAHFATFPLDLIEPCILAGSPRGGVVLDPFAGSGTVGIAAAQNGRGHVLIELNPNYIVIIKKRLASVQMKL